MMFHNKQHDCFCLLTAEKLRMVDISVYDMDPNQNPSAPSRLCFHYGDTMKAGVNVINCYGGSVPGQYVRITNVAGEALTLCEVQILAVPAAP
jgi:hypothetical protein